jgi:hypothetical protein
MKNLFKLIANACFVLAVAVGTAGAADFSTWNYKMRITFDGYGGSSDCASC